MDTHTVKSRSDRSNIHENNNRNIISIINDVNVIELEIQQLSNDLETKQINQPTAKRTKNNMSKSVVNPSENSNKMTNNQSQSELG